MKTPYLLFLGDATEPAAAKTAAGILQWRPQWCLGQTRAPGGSLDLGLPEMTPRQAAAQGAGTLVVGIANAGGFIPDIWLPVLFEALEAGLDVAAGLHSRLNDLPELRSRAQQLSRTLYDVRQPTEAFTPGNGRKRPGMRLLTVGTDCVAGKKYTALALEAHMRRVGLNASFRATGQTGIFISGRGVAVDAVISDFVAGAAEWLSPANSPDHWDIIEGQGSLLHPAYAGVTLGLIHGSQPDALVICHDPTRTRLVGWPHYPVPDIMRVADACLAAARLTNPNVQLVGVSLNTSTLSTEAAARTMEDTERLTGLRCADPVRHGVAPIVERLLELWP